MAMAMAEPVVAVVNNEPAYVHCLSDSNRILSVFRDAISKPLPTPSIAVSTMQEAMHPQKQTVLVQDENQLLENGLRSLLQEVVVSLSFHS
jgi:THO complex subunit 1